MGLQLILTNFHIRNYKSIADIDCDMNDTLTILAGKNESGKTNILHALEKLNSINADFDESEYPESDSSRPPRIEYNFKLLDSENKHIQESLGFHSYAEFDGLKFCIEPGKRYWAEKTIKDYKRLNNILVDTPESEDLVTRTFSLLDSLIPKVIIHSFSDNLPDNFTKQIYEDPNSNKIIKLLEKTIPSCNFKNVFDKVGKHQSQVAELGRYSANFNNDFSKRYTQNSVQISFHINNPLISIFIIDGDKGTPKSISQRSKGFQWYLSFHVNLKGSNIEDGKALVLIDEPGLFLHPNAQRNMLEDLREYSKRNQCIITTHSPYLIDVDRLDRIRIVKVEEKEEQGIEYRETVIFNKLHDVHDEDSVIPITDAIGYKLSDSLNIKKTMLITEGITDCLLFSAIKEIYPIQPDFGITFSTEGASGIPRIISLLNILGVENILILLDYDKGGHDAYKKLAEMIPAENIFDVKMKFGGDRPFDKSQSACIEDLFLDKFLKRKEIKTFGDKTSKYVVSKNASDYCTINKISIDDVLNNDGKQLIKRISEHIVKLENNKIKTF